MADTVRNVGMGGGGGGGGGGVWGVHTPAANRRRVQAKFGLRAHIPRPKALPALRLTLLTQKR